MEDFFLFFLPFSSGRLYSRLEMAHLTHCKYNAKGAKSPEILTNVFWTTFTQMGELKSYILLGIPR